MPIFALYCRDKADSLDLRNATRPAHLEYIAAAGKTIQLAGPLQNDAEESIGSLLIIDVESREDAERFAADDPYAKAELFERVDIVRLKLVDGVLAP